MKSPVAPDAARQAYAFTAAAYRKAGAGERFRIGG